MQQSANHSVEFNRDAVIRELYASNDLAAAIGKMEPMALREEMKQEVFVVLCAMDEGRLKEIHEEGYLKLFVYRTLWNMVKSDRSTFYNTHRKYSDRTCHGNVHLCIDGSIFTGGLRTEATISDFDSQTDFTSIIPDELIERGEGKQEIKMTHIEAAFDQLDPYEAELFRLYIKMGKNCRPIAAATKIPVRSIRNAISEARTKLKKQLRNA